ncbi:MAG TPA: 3-hydroxyacyl-CoA dehydrogenase family protein, partial [Candidatus Nitrosotalea sp.]|nr:3-hydroxyacyl-CoA dehydrogenase family protein [Candidatus Nitrosotalea sp.]
KYSGEQYERVNLTEELAKKFNPIQLLGNILNNAAWLVTNQASDVPEIEKALVLGMGLKKPLFDTAKQFGIQNIVSELEKLSKENKFYEPDSYLASLK